MKKNNIFIVFVLCFKFVSCAKKVENTASCEGQGHYTHQADCLDDITGSCESTVVQSGDQNVVCWKPAPGAIARVTNPTPTPTATNTATPTSTPTPTPYAAGHNKSWTASVWNPAECGPGVKELTRNVFCASGTGCTGTKPSTTKKCVPNLYKNIHYDSECTKIGGVVEFVEGKRICNLPGGKCVNDWTNLKDKNGILYTKTKPVYVTRAVNCKQTDQIAAPYHTTFEPAIDADKEFIRYCTKWSCVLGCVSWGERYSSITNVACY